MSVRRDSTSDSTFTWWWSKGHDGTERRFWDMRAATMDAYLRNRPSVKR